MDKWTEGPMLDPVKTKRKKHTKIKFQFEVDGETVLAQHSRYSGNEEIFVNGNLVSKKCTYTKTSRHDIDINGKIYKVIFIFRLKEPHKLRCHLVGGDGALKKLIYKRSDVYLNTIVSIFASFIVYIALIYIKQEYQMSEVYGVLVGPVTLVNYILFVSYFYLYDKGNIEEE